MNSNFTPGPWNVSGESITTDGRCICVIEDDGGYEVPGEQQKANARLIASAPDMYAEIARLQSANTSLAAACSESERCLAVMGCSPNNGLRQKLRAALADHEATLTPKVTK